MSRSRTEASRQSLRSPVFSPSLTAVPQVLTFSKPRLLLLELRSPDYYEVAISPHFPLPATVTVSANVGGIQLSSEEIRFTTAEQRIEVALCAVTEPETESFTVEHCVGDIRETLVCYYARKGGFQLFGCGLNSEYQLGSRDALGEFLAEYHGIGEGEREVCRPTPAVIDENDTNLFHADSSGETCPVDPPMWVSVAAGETHTLCVNTHGEVFSWGLGTRGQLGISELAFHRVAAELTFKLAFKTKPQKPRSSRDSLPFCVPSPQAIPHLKQAWQVACGARHSLVLTTDFSVYSFGAGESGQLGHGDCADVAQATAVSELAKVSIVRIAAGTLTSFFIDLHGQLYSCGAASEGALGHGARGCEIPTLVKNLEPVHWCSSGEAHTGVVTVGGVVVMFGSAEDGRLGTGDLSASWIRHSPSAFGGQKARNVVCGGRHTHVLTENLDMYSFGCNRYGQLGLARSDFQ